MNNIRLVRVDFRLMHGQVGVVWSKQVDADSIMIVNEKAAKDDFLKQVIKMAAPNGLRVSILDLPTALERIGNEKWIKRKVIVLFKSIPDLKEAFDRGFPIDEVQIGGNGSGTNKIQITNQIFINQEEYEMLKEINQKGVPVNFQVLPKDSPISLEGVEDKFG